MFQPLGSLDFCCMCFSTSLTLSHQPGSASCSGRDPPRLMYACCCPMRTLCFHAILWTMLNDVVFSSTSLGRWFTKAKFSSRARSRSGSSKPDYRNSDTRGNGFQLFVVALSLQLPIAHLRKKGTFCTIPQNSERSILVMPGGLSVP